MEVVYGPEAGKQGTVVAVLRNRNKIIVEGVRKVSVGDERCLFLVLVEW